MCFILTGKDGETKSWTGYRSIEVLGFHKTQKKTEVLLLLYIRNEEENNQLMLMHPGNVSCEAVDFQGGLPKHQDELRLHESNQMSILDSIYHKVFEFDQKNSTFYLRKILTLWDSLSDIDLWDQNEIAIWNNSPQKYILPLFQMKDNTKWSPFSAWKLGPFPSIGDYFLAVKVTLSNESYSTLVNPDSFFLVEGPKQLQSKLYQVFIPYFTHDDPKGWRKKLSFFNNSLRFRDGYDIVILDEPFADKVTADMKTSYSVTEGPLVADMDESFYVTENTLKPVSKKSFKRYITANSSFKLNLCYSESLTEDIEEFSFGEDSLT